MRGNIEARAADNAIRGELRFARKVEEAGFLPPDQRLRFHASNIPVRPPLSLSVDCGSLAVTCDVGTGARPFKFVLITNTTKLDLPAVQRGLG